MAKYSDKPVRSIRLDEGYNYRPCITYKVSPDKFDLVGEAPLEELNPIEPPQEFQPTFHEETMGLIGEKISPWAKKKLQAAIDDDKRKRRRGSGR